MPIILLLAAAWFLAKGGAKTASSGKVTVLDGKVVNSETLAIMERIAAVTGPFTITSGIRTPDAQAAAMLSKVQRGEDLHALYKADNIIDELMASGRDAKQWSAIIAKYLAQGIKLSDHLHAGSGPHAVDVRLQNADFLAKLTTAAQAAGYRVVSEPDHYHLEQ